MIELRRYPVCNGGGGGGRPFVSWTLVSGGITCNRGVTNCACLYQNNSYSINFIEHIIVPRHDRLRNNIHPMQPHFNPQPLARWRHSIITKWRVSK